jgi:hypothetical protein
MVSMLHLALRVRARAIQATSCSKGEENPKNDGSVFTEEN